jgi:hypothetical protein
MSNLVVLTVMTAWTCSRKLTSVSVPAQEVVSMVRKRVLSAGISLKIRHMLVKTIEIYEEIGKPLSTDLIDLKE